MNTVCRLSLLLLASLAGFLATNNAGAQWRYDPRVQAMLPPYCRNAAIYREQVPGGKNRTEIEHWKQILGESFRHIHHYCFGLESTNRALFTVVTAQDRERELRNSILEFNYAIDRVQPDFALLPEMLTKKGENLLRLRRAAEAIAVLARAIESKVDYWPPYAALSDYYKEVGNIEEAQQWLQKGLAASPGAAALERRLSKLSAR